MIYGGNPLETINLMFSDVPKYSLRINCRNSPRIAELAHILGKLRPRYKKVRRPDNNIEPEFILYTGKKDQQTKISDMLKKLTSQDRYLGKEIIILSPLSDGWCSASRLTGDTNLSIRSIHSLTSEKQIGYCSIYAFKGLESPIVILTDIEEVRTDKAVALLYTAITRAQDRLILFINNDGREDLLNTISGN